MMGCIRLGPLGNVSFRPKGLGGTSVQRRIHGIKMANQNKQLTWPTELVMLLERC